MGKHERVQYLAKLEAVLEIPEKERLTTRPVPYGSYKAKPQIGLEEIRERIRELDQNIEHNPVQKVQIRQTMTRTVEVYNARSIQDAIDVVMGMVDNHEIVLDEDDLDDVEVLEYQGTGR